MLTLVIFMIKFFKMYKHNVSNINYIGMEDFEKKIAKDKGLISSFYKPT